MNDPVFPVHMGENEEHGIAITLAQVCHFVHPHIVKRIRELNEKDTNRLTEIIPHEVDRVTYLYSGSACVFPGVRRYVGRMNPREKRKYVQSQAAIIDDNEFPRHLWAFLAGGTAYSGPSWIATRLNDFELAHVFAHKADERRVEQDVFRFVDATIIPNGLFTCASNVVLVPKGLAKPTDHLDSVKKAFFKRHVDLYGEAMLPGLAGLKDDKIPSWYAQLVWSEPILPDGWERSVEKLREYRFRRLRGLFTKPLPESDEPT